MSVAPLQFLLLVFAGWVNRHQAEVVAYLQEENCVLREQLAGRRLPFTDAQRRRLAAKGRAVGRRTLEQPACIVWRVPPSPHCSRSKRRAPPRTSLWLEQRVTREHCP